MNLAHNNYGLNGQSHSYKDWDNLFGLGRKAKKRKEERHKLKMAKRQAKVEERKAETERVRAETQLMQQTVSPAPPTPAATMPYTQQRIANPQTIAASGAGQQPVPQTQKAGFGGNAIMIVVGILLVGGYLVTKKKPAFAKASGPTGGVPAGTGSAVGAA
jgi:hypothetical protein